MRDSSRQAILVLALFGVAVGVMLSVSFSLVLQADAADVETFGVMKSQDFRQTNTSALVVNGTTSFFFNANLDATAAGVVTGVTLRLPSTATRTLSNTATDSFELEQGFTSKGGLDGVFSSGNYQFTIRAVNDGSNSPTLNLPADAYPNTPHISNWEAAQQVKADAEFILTWGAFVGGRTTDLIQVDIFNAAGDLILDTPPHPEDGFHGGDTALVIPANTLGAGSNYTGRVQFVRLVNVNTSVYPGATGYAAFGKASEFNLTTMSGVTAGTGTVKFTSASYTNNEHTDTGYLTVVRSGGNTGAAQVDVSITGGSALSGGDYTASPQTLSFAQGESAKTFEIVIEEDAQVETNETVTFALSNPVGTGLGAPSNTVLVILDNDTTPVAGNFQFSAATYTLPEAGPAALITVTRSGGSTGTATVNYATSGGNATADVDYTNTVGTLTFPSGVTSRTFTVPSINDTLDETNETVNLTLSDPTGGAVLGPRERAVLTITDNDVGGVLAFSAAGYTTNETSTNVLIRVNRTGGAASGVTVDYVTANGTATAGADYTAVSNSLTFATNQTFQTFLVPIQDDGAGEGPETFQVKLLNATGGAVLGTVKTGLVTIVDNEVVLQFSSLTYSNTEAGAAATITVQRTGPTTGSNTVQYTTADGTAVAPGDYKGTNGVLIFTAGATSRTFTVPLVNDPLDETNETAQLTLSNPTGVALLGPRDTATLVIVDDDSGGVLAFSAAGYTVGEAGPVANVVVSRTSGAASNVTVQFATADILATSADYTTTTGVLTFVTGQTSKTIAIPVTQDALDETNETFRVSLSGATGGATVGALSNTVVTITDDDAGGTLQLNAASYSVGEAGGMLTGTVNRTLGVASNVTVDLMTVDVTATAGSDYTAVSNTVVFAAGQTSRPFQVLIADDGAGEGPETFQLRLLNATGGAVLGTIRTGLVTIVDNEVVLQFSAVTYSNTEAGATATLTVQRTGPATGSNTVQYATANGSAVAGLDYSNRVGVVVIGPGATNAAVTVPLINDTLDETNETFSMILSNAAGSGALLGPRTNAVVTIIDNDSGGVLVYSAASSTVAEAGPVASVTVSRTGGTASGVTVGVATANGTATNGLDYTTVTNTLSFNAGQTSTNVTIPILQDTLDETNETFRVLLSNATGGATVGALSNTTVTITDDDVGGALAFSAAGYATNEADGVMATIRVNRTGGTASGVGVTVVTSNGTATASADYEAVETNLVFNAGDTFKIVNVPVLDDDWLETNETVNLKLLNPTGGATRGAQSNAVLTINGPRDVRGNYSLSASLTQSACSNAANNGVMSMTGFLEITDQVGGAFSGEGWIGNDEVDVNISVTGTVNSQGQVTDSFLFTSYDVLTFDEIGSGAGTILGTVSATGQLSFTLNGQFDTGETCALSGSASGTRLPAIVGTYNVTGSLIQTGCEDSSENGTFGQTGVVDVWWQEANEFGATIDTTGADKDLFADLGGTVNASGGVSGDFYDLLTGFEGTFTGTMNAAGQLTINFSAGDPFGTCQFSSASQVKGPLTATDVAAYWIAKGQCFQQTGAGAPVLDVDAPYEFDAAVMGVDEGTNFTAQLYLPDNALRALTNDGSGQFAYDEEFDTKDDLDAAYGVGSYVFDIVALVDGTRMPVLYFLTDGYPTNAPQVSNWSNAQAVNASTNFTLRWLAFSGGKTSDFVRVIIRDGSEDEVFSTPDIGETGALTGVSTSAVVAASTLLPGQTYQAEVNFVRIATLDTRQYRGARGIVAYYKRTHFELQTAP